MESMSAFVLFRKEIYFRMQPFACLMILINGIKIEPNGNEECTMDKQDFTWQVKQMERRLYRVAMSYTGNEADAADAVQEALLRAWAKRDTLRDENLFSTWMTRILINECKTLLRKRRRVTPMEPLPQQNNPSPPDSQEDLRTALLSLDPRFRVPLVLNALEGYTLREIAGMLRLPEGTVKSRVSRARRQLRMYNQEVNDDAE